MHLISKLFMAPSWVVGARAQSCGAGRGFPKRGVLLVPRDTRGWILCFMPFPGVQSCDLILSCAVIWWDYLLGVQYLCLIYPCPLLLIPKNCLNDGNSQSWLLATVFAFSKSPNFWPDWLFKLQLLCCYYMGCTLLLRAVRFTCEE